VEALHRTIEFVVCLLAPSNPQVSHLIENGIASSLLNIPSHRACKCIWREPILKEHNLVCNSCEMFPHVLDMLTLGLPELSLRAPYVILKLSTQTTHCSCYLAVQGRM